MNKVPIKRHFIQFYSSTTGHRQFEKKRQLTLTIIPLSEVQALCRWNWTPELSVLTAFTISNWHQMLTDSRDKQHAQLLTIVMHSVCALVCLGCAFSLWLESMPVAIFVWTWTSWHSSQAPCQYLDLHKSPLVLPSWDRGTRLALSFPLALLFHASQERKRCQPQVSSIRSALCQQTHKNVRGKMKCVQTNMKDLGVRDRERERKSKVWTLR